MKLLTKEQQKPYENIIICYIYKEKFENKCFKDKKYGEKKIKKSEIIVIIKGNSEVPNIAFVI